jgi:IS5 family transposase
MGLFEWVTDISGVKSKQFLDKMERIVPWKFAEKIIEPYWKRKGKMGRPQSDLRVLLKMMCLQIWYNLSDEAVEDQSTDRLSFREFLGIEAVENPIDATTICKFRKLLTEHKLMTKIQEKFTEELLKNQIILKEGTCVDATIIKTASSTKNKSGKRDPEMKSTKKGSNYYFGAKAHVSTDQKTKLIKKVRITPANVSDSRVFEQLLEKDERMILADKGYFKKDRKTKMRAKGVFCGILDKASRGKKLSGSQNKRNKKLASARAGCEHIFGIWKQIWGNRKLRYKGIRKNSEKIHFMAFLSNCFTISQKNFTPLLTG